MQTEKKSKLSELQTIITKMPLDVCCVTVLPEFGVLWREVSKAVRNNRLPMQPSSVARVLCRHARSLEEDELEDIVARLRLKLVATQTRKWHVVQLLEPSEEELSVPHLIRALQGRVVQLLRASRAGRNMRPDVQTVLLGDLLYMSVQMLSERKQTAVLYVATPPGQGVALVSCVSSSLLKACVQGLGYQTFEDVQLHGHDIMSLLKIYNSSANERAEHLAKLPEYQPVPVIKDNCIDFTTKEYDEKYVESIIGPDPPLLTELTITSTKEFYDPNRLNKPMSLQIEIKSEDIAKSLKSWVSKGALAPTSYFLQFFHKIKCNRFDYHEQDEEET